MVDLGQFSLLLALFLSGYAVIADLAGSFRKDAGFLKSGRNATGAALLCLSTATAALLVLLLTSDFRVIYVAAHTARSLPLAYKISALWAGAPGSLLLWLWLQVAFVVFVFCKGQTGKGLFASHGRAIANLVSVFFLLVMINDKNPFEVSTVAAADGAGLNPLLQHPAMVLHPPILFIGYAAFAVPFAWAVAALKYPKDETSIPLLEQSKRWTLVAWVFLTAGILLGAWWAYEELGWGGYWAWDPVENSSLMPWLTGTALVHCFRAFHSRGKTVLWTIFLSLLTFSLCVFGTFLTRSGLVSSVHAFSELENILESPQFLFIVLLISVWVIAGALMIKRHLSPKPDGFLPFEGPSQTCVVYNNYLMLFLTFVIFVGTLFPFFSGLISDRKITLEPAYFNKITAPGGFILILFIAACPYLWRHGFKIGWRIVVILLAMVASVILWLITKALAPAILICCITIFLSLLGDLIGPSVKTSSKSTPKRNLRWYGARVVHLGVALIFLGIAGSGGYGQEEQFAMVPGQQETIGKYSLVYEQLRQEPGPNFTAFVADVFIYEDDKLIAKLAPAKAVYSASNQSVSEVDIRRTLGGDLYVALTELDMANKRINLRVLIKPLINWIWIGSGLMVMGAALALVTMGGRRRATAKNEGIK
jgi:cytochrome c-type biogenesis protein CcmF